MTEDEFIFHYKCEICNTHWRRILKKPNSTACPSCGEMNIPYETEVIMSNFAETSPFDEILKALGIECELKTQTWGKTPQTFSGEKYTINQRPWINF